MILQQKVLKGLIHHALQISRAWLDSEVISVVNKHGNQAWKQVKIL